MSVLASLVRRDLVQAWRQGGSIGTALGFFLTVVVLLPLGIGPDQALLQRIAPGALWIALLLSVLLSSDQIFQADYEDGSLEQMTLGPAPLEMIALAKAFAHWLSAGLPLAIIAPLLGFLLNLDPRFIVPLSGAMIIGSMALSLLGCLGAAVTVGLRRGGMLVSLLILPLYIPALIFGVSASTSGLSGPDIATPSLLILVAIVLVALVTVPLAAAAALRTYLK